MNGVDLVRSRYPDLSVQFNACVQKGIMEHMDDMLKIAEDKGVKISFDIITEGRRGQGDTQFTQTAMALPPDELREAAKRLLARKSEGAPILNSEMYFRYFVEDRPGYKCHFPKIAMCVNGRGDVENCLDLNNNIANIRETPLKDIMAMPAFSRLRKDAEQCHSCNSPTMVDLSLAWEDPKRLFERGAIEITS